MLKKLAMLTSAVALSGCAIVINGGEQTYLEKTQLQFDASDIKTINMIAGSGKLHVIGDKSANQISIEVAAYLPRDMEVDEVLKAEKTDDSEFSINSTFNSSGFYSGNSPRVNLFITVPSNVSLNIDDGSGDIKISNINGNLSIVDGSGDILISQINGKVSVDDGSGSLQIEHVNGEMNIIDGSGEILISKNNSAINLDDQSGDLRIENNVGDVSVIDGSGDLEIVDVDGRVTIADGSGDIYVRNVSRLRIRESGSGDLDIDGVDSFTTK